MWRYSIANQGVRLSGVNRVRWLSSVGDGEEKGSLSDTSQSGFAKIITNLRELKMAQNEMKLRRAHVWSGLEPCVKKTRTMKLSSKSRGCTFPTGERLRGIQTNETTGPQGKQRRPTRGSALGASWPSLWHYVLHRTSCMVLADVGRARRTTTEGDTGRLAEDLPLCRPDGFLVLRCAACRMKKDMRLSPRLRKCCSRIENTKYADQERNGVKTLAWREKESKEGCRAV